MGRALDDIDRQRVRQLERDARVLDPRQGLQFGAQGSDIDFGHGAALLRQDAGIDQPLVHPLGPGDAHMAHLEPGIGGDLGHLRLRQRGNARKTGDDQREAHRPADDDREPDAAPLFLGEGQQAHQPVDEAARLAGRLARGDRAALRLGGAPHAGGGATPDLLRHAILPCGA